MRDMFALLWHDLRKMNGYLIAAVAVFAAGWAAGATGFGGMDDMARQSAEGIGVLAERIMASNHPQLWMFVFLFFNNAIKAVLFMFLGAFLGLLPLYVLFANGGVLGYVLQTASGSEMSGVELFVKGILPHGIIELPALFLSCGYGIRFGFLLVRGLFLAMVPARRQQAGADILHFLTVLVPLSLCLVTAMLVAAIIETLVTPLLLA